MQLHGEPIVQRAERLLALTARAAASGYGFQEDQGIALLRECYRVLAQYLDEDGGCDHSVGICMCAEINLAERLEEFLGFAVAEQDEPCDPNIDADAPPVFCPVCGIQALAPDETECGCVTAAEQEG